MAYASPPSYYAFADAPSTPLRSFFGAGPSPSRHFGHSRHASHDVSGNSSPGSSYPSPRYASNGRYATNTRIAPPFGDYVSDDPRPRAPSHHIPRSKPTVHREAYPSRRSRSFPFSDALPRFRVPAATSYRRSDSPGVVSDDEFIPLEDGRYIHIVNGSPAHRRPACYHSSFERTRERETNHYGAQGLNDRNYDLDGKPFVFVDAQPRFDDTPKRSRARGASTSTPRRPSTAHTHRERPSTSSKKTPLVVPKATEEDARRQHIPAGYSLKNWDPTETPILLLGSVFDANSLGKWIYDWTVFRHGPATPISDVAGELWLLLIKLAGKVKRSEECLGRIRRKADREMVDGFVEAGEKLMDKLARLLKACEGPMLKAGRKKGGEAVLGKNAGVEFVETLFGRERQLEGTEKFMTSCRLWNMRFDANCEEILRNPTA